MNVVDVRVWILQLLRLGRLSIIGGKFWCKDLLDAIFLFISLFTTGVGGSDLLSSIQRRRFGFPWCFPSNVRFSPSFPYFSRHDYM